MLMPSKEFHFKFEIPAEHLEQRWTKQAIEIIAESKKQTRNPDFAFRPFKQGNKFIINTLSAAFSTAMQL